MKLNSLDWKKFLDYLIYERRYKQTKGNIDSVRSRFLKIKTYFSTREFNRENFREFLKELESKYSGATVNKYLSISVRIEQFLDLKLGLERFAYLPEFARDEVPLNEDELLNIASYEMPYKRNKNFLNLRNKTLYLLSGHNGGNRVGEAINLKWEDVYNAPIPHIIFRDTKSRKNRKVAITASIWKLMNDLPKTSNYVFASYRGNRQLRSQEVNIDLQNRAKLCGVNKHVHYHLLRTTYATEMSENPLVNPLDTADIMGYSDPKVILERYKKSTLTHMSEVIHAHPALRGEKTPEMVSSQLITAFSQIVDRHKYPIELKEENGELVIRVKGLKLPA